MLLQFHPQNSETGNSAHHFAINPFQMPKLTASQLECIIRGLGEVIDLNKITDDSFQILFHMTTHNLISLGPCSVSCFFIVKLTESMSSQKAWGERFIVFSSYEIAKASLICPQFVKLWERASWWDGIDPSGQAICLKTGNKEEEAILYFNISFRVGTRSTVCTHTDLCFFPKEILLMWLKKNNLVLYVFVTERIMIYE